MTSTIHRGPSMQSISFDELGIVQIQSDSIDDSSSAMGTLDSRASELTQRRPMSNGKTRRPLGPVKSNSNDNPPINNNEEQNQETVEDVRAWAKEASFKLKSFNFKMPGDKGSPLRKSPIPIPMITQPSPPPPPPAAAAFPSTTTGIAIPPTTPAHSQQSMEAEEIPNVTNSTTTETIASGAADSVLVEKEEEMEKVTEAEEKKDEVEVDEKKKDEKKEEEVTQEPVVEVEQSEQATTIEQINDEEETVIPNDTSTVATNGRKKKGIRGDNQQEEEDNEDELAKIALRATTQNTFVKRPVSPVFTNVNLRPVPKVIESKTFTTDKSSTNIYSFLQLKAISRDSVSTLSGSHDETDQLSTRSEPMPKKKPSERIITPYDELKKMSRLKVYGDYLPEELESYLSPEEFHKVFGKSRPEFYALPLWKQHFLKKRAQIF